MTVEPDAVSQLWDSLTPQQRKAEFQLGPTMIIYGAWWELDDRERQIVRRNYAANQATRHN